MNSLQIAQPPILPADKWPANNSTLSLDNLMHVVCTELKLKKEWILGNERHHYLCEAREIFCHIALRHDERKPMEIAAYIQRHRTTVLHAIKRIDNLLYINDAVVKEKYELILKSYL